MYESGTPDEYARCYTPTWGHELARTRPALGNHDATSARGAAYFAYFGAAAGEPGAGYYSYDAGAWHVIVLNSECWMTPCVWRAARRSAGCAPTSPRIRTGARSRTGISRTA